MINTDWAQFDWLHAMEFRFDNIDVSFENTVYQQVVGISLASNCESLVSDLIHSTLRITVVAKLWLINSIILNSMISCYCRALT